MASVKITNENFEAETGSGAVLVDFWAEWCGPCKMLGPVIEEISEEEKDFKVGKIDITTEKELAQQFGVMSIPTLVLFRDGKEVDRLIGAYPKEAIVHWVKEKL